MTDYSGTVMEALRAGGFGANAEAYQASGLRDDPNPEPHVSEEADRG